MMRTTAILVLLAGCSSETDTNRYGDTPTGGDRSPGDSASGGCAPGNPDAICATNLADVTISWSGTLELCNYWNDGADLSVEQGRQVHLTVTPQTRSSLSESALASATLDDVRVRHGPFAAEQWHVTSAASMLDTYELTGAPTSASLNAVITHTLGAAGTLVEDYTVWRPAGNTDPVDVDGGLVSFVYFKPGQSQPQFAIHLRACGGYSSFVEHTQVLTGEDQATGNEVTVLRTLRSTRPGGITVGSYPVHLTGARVTLSDSAWQSHVVSSYWAQTYAAQHHNFDEHSLIDFERNLTHYHTHFGPNGTMTGEVVQHVELFHIAGSTPPQFIGVTFENLDTGAERTVSYDVTTRWSWVGEASLHFVHLNSVCASTGDLFVVGWGDYEFHLATCPRVAAPGFELRALVPLVFAHDMAQAGIAFTDTDITEITDGFRVNAGGSEIDIVEFNETYLQLNVRDGTGASMHGSLTTATELQLSFHDDELMRFENGEVYAEVNRRWAGQGVGESYLYAPVHLVLTFAGQTHYVEAWDLLDYTNTHHNWADALIAEDDTIRMVWHVEYQSGPLVYYVRAETLAGVEVLAETEMTLLP